jgi:glycosyltransferase involved in cell wall biosynthesis
MVGLSILMPVYNEAATVHAAVEQVRSAELAVDKELIVVDDGSTDGTGEILADLGGGPVRVVKHERNRGKGAAIRTALGQARYEVAAVFDADLEYSPNDLNLLLPPILAGDANAVFGVRAFNGYSSHSFVYVMGNRIVTLWANILFNVYLRDLMTCHKAIRTELFRQLPLRADGFDIEAEIAARLLQQGERIFEVPVQYQARPTAAGKKLTSADGWRVIRTLLRCRFPVLDRRRTLAASGP